MQLRFVIALICGAALLQNSDPALEEKLIGTWHFITVDAICYFTFYRDHTFTGSLNDGKPFPGGTWSVAGAELVLDMQPKIPGSEDSPLPRRVMRVAIAIRDGELELDKGYWKRDK